MAPSVLRIAPRQQGLIHVFDAGLSTQLVSCLNFVYQFAHAALEYRKPFPPLGVPMLVLVSVM